jgi:hypothetical protein
LLAEEYLTINELAARLKIKPKTIKNKMASGIFKKGIHYFSPRGLRPRFKWSAVQAWIEEKETQTATHHMAGIPMARGYVLGGSKPGLNK